MERDDPTNAQSKCTSGTEKTTNASEDFSILMENKQFLKYWSLSQRGQQYPLNQVETLLEVT